MTPAAFCRILGTTILLTTLVSRSCAAETPTPLADWQFSAGEVLSSLDGPVPDWRVTLGPGVDVQPTYPGAKRYTIEPAGIVDLRYLDLAFLSDGEGIGVNILRGQGYRAGVAISYDLGRNHHDDPRLAQLANISPAAEPKLFAQTFLKVVVLTANMRKGLGGHDGVIGDVGAYMPLPIAPHAFLFVGPTISLADSRYMKAYFGVDAAHAKASGLPVFAPAGGLRETGLGATAIYLLGDHWLLNADAAYQRLLGDAARSPITEAKTQFTADFNIGYRF